MNIVIDSSVLVAALRKDEEKHKECLHLFQEVKDGKHTAIEPYSVLVEVVAAIRRRTGSQEIAKRVKNDFLQIAGLDFIPIDSIIAQEAADIAAVTGVRGMDALVIQTVKKHDAILVSIDEEMTTKAKAVVKVKEVGEFR